MIDVPKLIKLCGMLSSDYEAERSLAAKRASDMLRASGLTWEDVIARSFDESSHQNNTPQSEAPKERRTDWGGGNIRSVLDKVKSQGANLTPWETEFLDSVYIQFSTRGGCTMKQWLTLQKIAKEKGVI